ncbi:hypothetical protein ABE437_02065, partial [Isoptericola cucumis]
MTSMERLDDLTGRGPAGSPADTTADGPEARPPGGLPDDLAAATARLHAWHAVADGPPGADVAGRPGPDHPGPEGPDPDGPQGPGPGELADRLRARRAAGRSARHVAAAYAATHGHPLDEGDDASGRRRWGLGLRTAVVASVVVLVLALGVSVVAFLQPDDVVTLAGAERQPAGAASTEPSAEADGPD